MDKNTVTGRLGNLLLALLNATLILAIICLWMAWNALSAADRVTENLSEAASKIEPARAELRELTQEIAATREEIAAARTQGAPVAALEAKITGIDAKLAQLNQTVSGLAADPQALIDHAVRAAFSEIGGMVALTVAGRRGGEGSE